MKAFGLVVTIVSTLFVGKYLCITETGALISVMTAGFIYTIAAMQGKDE